MRSMPMIARWFVIYLLVLPTLAAPNLEMGSKARGLRTKHTGGRAPATARNIRRGGAKAKTSQSKFLGLTRGGEEEEALVRGSISEAGGVLVHIVCGTIYCWANFLSYAPKNLLFFDGEDHPGMTPDAVQVMPYALIAQNLGLPLGSALNKAFGPRVTTLIGSSLYVLGVYISSHVTRLVPFMLSYSFLAGLGVGTVYTAPMIAGWTWFPKNKGLVNGITLFGFGSGAFVFNKVSTSLAQSGVEWGAMLRKLAFLYAALSFPGSMLIKAKPKVYKPAVLFRFSRALPEEQSATFMQALKSKRFKLLWLLGVCALTPALTVMGLYKRYGMCEGSLVADDSFLSLVGGLGAIASGVGRVIWGRLIDKLGFQVAWTTTTVIQFTTMLLMPLATTSKAAFAALVCSSLLCLGGTNSMFITINAQTFGVRNAGEIYSVLFSAVPFSSVFGTKMAATLLGQFGWNTVFRVLACMCIANMGLLAVLRGVMSQPLPLD